MKKVITYGSYDLFHFGHQRLLERAKALGDYLIVGVTSDDYDKVRGKINGRQSLAERIAAVEATGIADEIIIEEYDGQKIDDIKKYNVDIFTVGSDWEGKFDYLSKYCKVVYLDRTEGVSSSEIRSKQNHVVFGLVADSDDFVKKVLQESKSVNGIDARMIYLENKDYCSVDMNELQIAKNYDGLIKNVDAIYIKVTYENRYEMIKKALLAGKHVLYESPLCLSRRQCKELFELAKNKNCILMEAIRSAYSVAYKRMVLLAEIGKIGEIVSISSTCTSMRKDGDYSKSSSLYEWGSNALLPIFQLLGINYSSKIFNSKYYNGTLHDMFTNIHFVYSNAVANVFVAEGAKSEGELIISGTDGYIYVPAPWWKTEYFELRYEDASRNRRYFYQLDGEGIRYELVEFLQAICDKKDISRIDYKISEAICGIMEDFKKQAYISN